jgi:hypothetical protein
MAGLGGQEGERPARVRGGAGTARLEPPRVAARAGGVPGTVLRGVVLDRDTHPRGEVVAAIWSRDPHAERAGPLAADVHRRPRGFPADGPQVAHCLAVGHGRGERACPGHAEQGEEGCAGLVLHVAHIGIGSCALKPLPVRSDGW